MLITLTPLYEFAIEVEIHIDGRKPAVYTAILPPDVPETASMTEGERVFAALIVALDTHLSVVPAGTSVKVLLDPSWRAAKTSVAYAYLLEQIAELAADGVDVTLSASNSALAAA
ncbi:hypothetical protein [Tranquillimonas alkanivorans]|uniref:Uncharacterized protein n=1 Tax=Tranquillimonas alkanivorans TaxID=441119 RepID=A0A1I5TV34_9RHOB|nr:hypothetical protein [Tranquillimonas alkanivorans]SFP86925.1 hypothetical protein SAMN04488047_11544 [Tranquillimonas alkanivorans]